MKRITTIIAFAFAACFEMQAQVYSSLGVYDTWEESPFMTGRLEGNIAETSNPYKDANNMSAMVVGFQRSRFGSNTFGARIDLKNPFELTQAPKYVHVKVYKPKEGRTMLVGLGKRQERTDQNPRAEQFWVYSSETIPANCWTDAVFEVNGHGGIDINSLVLVPDCESTHNLKADFAVYFSDVEINSSPEPRFQVGKGGTATAESAKDYCKVTANNRNGDVLAADGTDLNNLEVTLRAPFKIKMQPSRGFTYTGIRIHYEGGEKWVPKADFNADDTYTIPAEYMMGDVLIDGEFFEVK